jgi:hypothetical protein
VLYIVHKVSNAEKTFNISGETLREEKHFPSAENCFEKTISPSVGE